MHKIEATEQLNVVKAYARGSVNLATKVQKALVSFNDKRKMTDPEYHLFLEVKGALAETIIPHNRELANEVNRMEAEIGKNN